MRIHKGDSVVVISGNEKSATPRRVIGIVDGGKLLLVEGVSRVLKHVRRGHPKSPQGGRLSLETPIDGSNVMLYCDSCNHGVRVGFRYTSDGVKERFCRKCKKSLGVVGQRKKTQARK